MDQRSGNTLIWNIAWKVVRNLVNKSRNCCSFIYNVKFIHRIGRATVNEIFLN